MFRFTLRQIEIFLAVARFGGFRRAGDELGISGASVSGHICGLEDQLGCKLFERQRGAVSHLTMMGSRFQEEALEFVSLGHKLGSINSAEEEHDLFLLIGDHILNDFIRPALPDFYIEHPEIRLSVAACPSRVAARQAALARSVDGVVITVEHEELLPGSVHLADVAVAIFGAPALLASLSGTSMQDWPFLVPAEGTENEMNALNNLRAAGIPDPRIEHRFQYYDVGVGMALRGAGLICTIESVVRSIDRDYKLQRCDPITYYQRRLWLDSKVSERTRAVLTEFMRKAAGTMSQR